MRKKHNTIAKWLVLIILGFIVFKCITSDPIADSKAKSAKMEEAHCKLDWSKLDKSKKETVLNEYIENAAFVENSPVKLSQKLLKESTKYPGTIEDGYPYGTIEDIDKGTILYQSSFTSENKLGMKVKGHYWLKIKYIAGCKPFEVISFNIE